MTTQPRNRPSSSYNLYADAIPDFLRLFKIYRLKIRTIMLGYVTFHPPESLVNSEDIKVGRTSIHDFFHNYLIIYRSVNMKTLEVYVEIISYFGQMHDFVVRVDGKYRNRPGLRFLSQINASERHPKVTISIRYIDSDQIIGFDWIFQPIFTITNVDVDFTKFRV